MKQKRKFPPYGVTVLLLIVGILFLGIGIWREEYTIVMSKAINICLECIGIG